MLSCAAPQGAAVQTINHVRDVYDLRVATDGNSALALFAIDGDTGCVVDGCYVFHQLAELTFERSGAVSGIGAPPNSEVGISPSTDGTPFVMGGALHMLTQGHAGAAAMREAGRDAADTIYIAHDGKVLTRSPKWFTGTFAAVGMGSFALALGAGREWGYQLHGSDDAPRSVRAFHIASDGKLVGELVWQDPAGNPSEQVTAPTVAAEGTTAAYGYLRQAKSGAPADLWIGLLDPATAKPIGQPQRVAQAVTGAPALLVDRGLVYIVYATRVDPHARYQLWQRLWRVGEPAPSSPTQLTSPTLDALAPALTKVDGRILLAWMDATNERRGSIWAGSGTTAQNALTAGTRRSEATVGNARDPAWGAGAHRAVLAWTEHDGPRMVRLSWCQVE
ncbi:MAG: hypothetical protein ACHREM_24900 [Polyangiales bacterium]